VLADLTQMGYDCKWGIISASDVGAPHKRERIWIVAHAQHSRHSDTLSGKHGKEIQISGEHRQERSGGGLSSGTGELVRGRKANKLCDKGDVSNPQRMGREKGSNEQGANGIGETSDNLSHTHQALCADSPEWWSTEPLVGRVAHEVADRVDRLKAIGNGQVPLCATTAWRILSGN